MTEERFVQNGDITLRVEVTGEGPTILCVHGWPELAYSWRHQVDHFASRGHQVAAMDVRGYGGSSVPVDVERYTLRELAGDAATPTASVRSPVSAFPTRRNFRSRWSTSSTSCTPTGSSTCSTSRSQGWRNTTSASTCALR